MLKPYSKRHLTVKERTFNYRLSRARRMIENCFGILSARWRIFKVPINANVKMVENIVRCCVCLHNWINQDKTSHYISTELVDREINNSVIPGSWREESNNFLSLQRSAANATFSAKSIRDNYAEYFLGSGKVDWQDHAI